MVGRKDVLAMAGQRCLPARPVSMSSNNRSKSRPKPDAGCTVVGMASSFALCVTGTLPSAGLESSYLNQFQGLRFARFIVVFVIIRFASIAG